MGHAPGGAKPQLDLGVDVLLSQGLHPALLDRHQHGVVQAPGQTTGEEAAMPQQGTCTGRGAGEGCE